MDKQFFIRRLALAYNRSSVDKFDGSIQLLLHFLSANNIEGLLVSYVVALYTISIYSIFGYRDNISNAILNELYLWKIKKELLLYIKWRYTVSGSDIILGLIIVVIWSLNYIAINVGLVDIPPLLLRALRFLAVTFPAIFFCHVLQLCGDGLFHWGNV